jgi:farnesyl-diphosphate farnesyltransferase
VADLERLLERTSRTFALNIPLLPEPTRRQVTVSYLLFRIADTFEDSVEWPLEQRLDALDRFARLIERPKLGRARRLAKVWTRVPPLEHPGYTELLEEAPAVFDVFASLDPEAREVIGEHVVRTAEGMGAFVARAGETGDLRLRDLADLREYCYVVAGIVGEMLTALFLLGRPELEAVRDDLEDRSADFGEGLQLTNILRDSSSDAGEGRRFLPEGIDRAAVFVLARRDLDRATEYTHILQETGAPRGLVAFNALPVALARATLARVEMEGPGAKLDRKEVARLVATVETALDLGRPALSPDGASSPA